MSWQPDDVPSMDDAVTVHIPADGSDVIVFQDQNRRWYRFTGTATSIWAAIDGTRTVAEILDVISVQHGVSADEIADDVLAMFSQLSDARILR